MHVFYSVSASKENICNPVQMFSVVICMLISLRCTAWIRATILSTICCITALGLAHIYWQPHYQKLPVVFFANSNSFLQVSREII